MEFLIVQRDASVEHALGHGRELQWCILTIPTRNKKKCWSRTMSMLRVNGLIPSFSRPAKWVKFLFDCDSGIFGIKLLEVCKFSPPDEFCNSLLCCGLKRWTSVAFAGVIKNLSKGLIVVNYNRQVLISKYCYSYEK